MKSILIIFITFWIQFFISLEHGCISPIAPYLAETFNMKESSVAYLNLGFAFVGLLAPFLGYIADKYGKKLVISFSLFIFALGSLIGTLANDGLVFMIGRLIIGIGASALTATLVSYISDFVSYDNRGRAIGLIRIAFGISILVSPIYATNIVYNYSLNTLYLILTIAMSILFIASLFLPRGNINLDSTHNIVENKIKINDIKGVLKEKVTVFLLLIQFLINVPTVLVYGYLSIWLKNYVNANQNQIGLVYTIAAIGTIVGILIATVFSDRIGKMKFTETGLTITLIFMLLIPFNNSLAIISILTFLFAMGIDAAWASFEAIASEVSIKGRTIFLSLIYSMISLSSFVSYLVGPTIYDYGEIGRAHV